MSPQCIVTALTVLIAQMTYICPAGSLLHSQSTPHRAFVIVGGRTFYHSIDGSYIGTVMSKREG